MQNDVSQPSSLADHVEAAADSLRSAIHAAYDAPGSDSAVVGGLYRTVADLTLVVDRLPELIRHVAHRIDQLADVVGLETDDSTEMSGPDTAHAAATDLNKAALEIASIASGRPNPIAEAHSRLGALKLPAGES